MSLGKSLKSLLTAHIRSGHLFNPYPFYRPLHKLRMQRAGVARMLTGKIASYHFIGFLNLFPNNASRIV